MAGLNDGSYRVWVIFMYIIDPYSICSPIESLSV